MLSRAIKGHLACPLAVIVAAGLVIAPINSGSVVNSPRFVEFSAVRLQAEATTLIAGVADNTAAKAAAAIPGAAAASSATAAATAPFKPCYYPCTIFDKFLDSLSPEIRSIILPPLMYLAIAIGAVMAPFVLVTSLIFDWPYELGPAAATRPEDPAPPAQAGEPDDNASTAMQADPIAPAAVPSVPAADEAEGGPVARGRVAQQTAADAPAEVAVSAPDAPQTAEPQPAAPQTVDPQTAKPGPIELELSEQNTDAAVATEPQPDSTEAVITDLTEMTQPRVASEAAEAAEAAEVDATDVAAVADEQPTEAATHSATEAPAAAGSPRAAKRSAR